jgi:hypothetical protein
VGKLTSKAISGASKPATWQCAGAESLAGSLLAAIRTRSPDAKFCNALHALPGREVALE